MNITAHTKPVPQAALLSSAALANAGAQTGSRCPAAQDTFEGIKTTTAQKAAGTESKEPPRHVIITAVVLTCAAAVALPVLAVAGVLAGIGLLVGYIHSRRHDISNYFKEVLLAS